MKTGGPVSLDMVLENKGKILMTHFPGKKRFAILFEDKVKRSVSDFY